ncbi:ABC transporter substrate-binding protein [Methylobacterium planeticum]|uniref:ABC transporter substrate-binding protein n=2 Tax=Methylobacterium planeticum TaxID=2615211 RepID=A0A6N6MRC5_9HYPH|nr:ABC transporter substrate-binding protein [Methylobacterium planeticum]
MPIPKDIAVAQDLPSRLAREIAPTGSLRAAINFGNPVLAQRGADGTPAGVSADLARELGHRLGVPVGFETFDTAGAVVEALGGPRTWDVAFLAIDPHRAQTIAFSPPYVIIEGAYMVREGSPLTRNDQVDHPGIRIAVGRNTAYDLYLGRRLERAERVYAPTSADALALFLREGPEVLASVRQPLEAYAREHKDVRILPGRFMVIEQAVATPKDRPAGRAYIRAFVEEMKASGFVAEALDRSGQPDAVVAPAAR